jgi:hypothetical protein
MIHIQLHILKIDNVSHSRQDGTNTELKVVLVFNWAARQEYVVWVGVGVLCFSVHCWK